MKKRFLIALICLIAVCALIGCSKKEERLYVESHDVIGCGGYGAVFNAQIDPFCPDNFAATCDMGCVYFSYDRGESWTRHNIFGTFYCLKYDPCTEGVIWAGGSGLYKSTDHGKTLKRVFPSEEETVYEGYNYENANYWLYSDKKSDYAPQYQILSIAINRKSGGKNVFVGQRVPAAGFGYAQAIRISRTTDGEHFELFCELEYSYNFKLDYDETNDCLIVVTENKIYEIDGDKRIYEIDRPVVVQFHSGNNISFDSCYDPVSGRNTFAFSSPRDGEHSATACYVTDNLRDEASYAELTSELCSLTTDDFGVENVAAYNKGKPSYEYCEWIKGKTVPQRFKWTINDVHVHNDDVIYLFHEANTDVFDSDGKLYINRRTIIYLKYDRRKAEKARFTWVFGNPLKPYDTAIVNTTWQDADSDYCFGMSSSPENDDALLYCSNVGIYYTSDGREIKQLNSKLLSRDELTFTDKNGNTAKKTLQRVTTTGTDVICTQTVAADPFDENHLLNGCTDIGLLQSYDNGRTWYHSLNEWQNGELKGISYAPYTNTCFDIHFDRQNKNVVYALWSLPKTAPYAPNVGYITGSSRFGISYDGGLSWTMKKITPDGCGLPWKMQVVYNGKSRLIYITTDSHGFFLTRDLGESFEPLNDGIATSQIGGKTAIWGTKLIVTDTEMYAITGGSATDSSSRHFYRAPLNGSFEEIALPSSEHDGKVYNPASVRDIVYDKENGCVYLACTANVVTNYSKIEYAAGGIWKYRDGEYTLLYDEKSSVCCLALDGRGRLFAAETGGKLMYFTENNTRCEALIDGLFYRPKKIDFGTDEKIIYVSTWGGGTERLILRSRA